MFPANIVPGQGFQNFEIYEKSTGLTDTGRAVTEKYTGTDKTLFGMLTSASQQEIALWNQNSHPITHKIVQYSAMTKAKATDYLKCNGRWFYVTGIKNHGDMNISITYYVEEKAGLPVENNKVGEL